MPFLSRIKEISKKGTGQLKDRFQSFQTAQPAAPKPITKAAVNPRGIISNGLFTGPTTVKKKRKAKRAITISLDGQKIRVVKTAVKKKRAKRKTSTAADFDIVGGFGVDRIMEGPI